MTLPFLDEEGRLEAQNGREGSKGNGMGTSRDSDTAQEGQACTSSPTSGRPGREGSRFGRIGTLEPFRGPGVCPAKPSTK